MKAPIMHVLKPIPENTSIQPKKLYFFLAGVAIIGVILLRRFGMGADINKFQTQIIPASIKKVLNDPNVNFKISDVKDTNGIYEFILSLTAGNDTKKYTSYITKDGKILFTSGVKLESLKPQTLGAKNERKAQTCQDLSKAESPKLTAFIVANCPFGLQMQRAFNKTLGEIPQLLPNLNIKYIGAIENGVITSMHGDKEAQENLRQICIREEQKEKYWPYVSCYMQEGKTDECLNSAQVDQNMLKSCVDGNNRGLKYAQADFDMANKFNINSSPTLLLNGQQVISEFDFGGRTPNALKDIACCGSNSKADFCTKDASKDDVTTSFSKIEASANTGNTSAASCGNQ